MTLHSVLTGAELHETKGAAAATAGHVLVATGAATAVYEALLGNVVRVNELADLPTAAAGKITLLAATNYVFGADVNIGTDYLQYSAGTSVQSSSAFSATITYTGTNPMHQGADGNATIKDITFNCANADVYSWVDGTPGTSIILISEVLIIACQEIGTFDEVATVVMDGTTIVSCTSGLTFLGSANTGIRIQSANFLSTDVNYIGLDFTTATNYSVNVGGIVMTGGVGSIGIKGDAVSANIRAGFIANVSNVQMNGVTTTLSGISIDDFRWNFQGNGILADTMPDALTAFVGNATVTTLSVGVPTLIAGTFVEERASQYTTTAAGRVTYLGERDIVTPVDISVVIDPVSGTNKSLRAYLALNGSAILASGIAVNISSGDPKQISVPWQLNISQNDYLEIFIENETDSANATVIDCTLRVR